MSHYRGWRRPVLILLLLGMAGGAAYFGLLYLGGGEEGDSEPVKAGKAARLPEKSRSDGESGEPATVPAGQAEKSEDASPPEAPATLTEQRTWTARNGRTLEASLLRLSLVDRQYVGVFEKPGGEIFEYKIGNLSPADVELVKGIVGKK